MSETQSYKTISLSLSEAQQVEFALIEREAFLHARLARVKEAISPRFGDVDYYEEALTATQEVLSRVRA